MIKINNLLQSSNNKLIITSMIHVHMLWFKLFLVSVEHVFKIDYDNEFISDKGK